ncbi:MAG: nuclear transport factor 2 family protein [Gemmatimonadaceae bacterium]
MKRFALAAFILVVSTAPAFSQAAETIRSLRARSNAAIARHDVDSVLSFFDVEYQITTGSGSFGRGKPEERAAWVAEFARAADLVYVRTPATIDVGASGDKAAEIGEWTGSWTTAQGVRKVGGRYAAYWRLVDGAWRMRSELFVTLRCQGPGCS